jgi:outer membrane protein
MRNNIKHLLLPVLCTVLFSNAGHASDLWGLYQQAQDKDPTVGRATARLEGSKADQDYVLATLLPHVDSGGGVRRIFSTTLHYGPRNIEGAYNGYNYNISSRIPLVHVPTWFNLSASGAGVRGAEAGLTSAKQDLIARLGDAYFTLLKAQADERLAREEIARTGKILEQAQAFLKAGTGDIIAVYEAKARLDSASADLVRAESSRKLAEQRLSAIAKTEVSTINDLGAFTLREPQPAGLDWWVSTMEKQHPDLIQARENLSQAEKQRKASRAGHLPVLQMSGGYDVSKGSTFLPEVETKQWYFGANISFPIFSGGETVAQTRRALAAESERRFMLDDVYEQQRAKLKEAYFNLQFNVSLITAYSKKKESMELQLDGVRKGRSIGTRSNIDLLNAEQSYATSLRDLKNAQYDNVVRSLQLKAAAGILSENDLTELNSALIAHPPSPR